MGDEGDKKGKKDDTEEVVDERLEFILAYLTKSYRLKQEKWAKMIVLEENKVIVSSFYNSNLKTYVLQKMINNFLDNPEAKLLILTMSAGGALTPLTKFTNVIRTKYTYFIKKVPEVVTMENFRQVIFFGDMAARPIEELSVILENVFLPVLSNPNNQKGWPKVVADDVEGHVRTFKNVIQQVLCTIYQ